MGAIRQWLEERGLAQYAETCEANDIGVDVLHTLTDQDLQALGVSLGNRRRLLEELKDTAPSVGRVPPATTVPENPPTNVETTGERRQLTVMFCDLVGSAALSEKLDPEELRSLLHNYRTVCGEVISRYEGFVARYVGDGILTYFGWPKAHEEDAERALRAALEIIQTVKSASVTEALSVRIGIATGPVVVGEQAGVGEQSKLAIGSTPNLAARLQGVASADQIVVASSTRRLVGNVFELADLGEHELKGISEPVHAWRVLAVSAAASRFDAATQGAMTPMVGREQEIGLLFDRWQQAQQGEGQVVLLSGEPGIGKSRVMSTLRERLETQGVAALRFQCSPYHVNSAFYPSIDNFERVFKFSRDEPVESKLDKLEAPIVNQLGRPLSDVRFIASILSIPYEPRYGALPMIPQKFKDETLRTLVDLSEASARKQPTVMLFEDAHWADPTSLEVLDLLIDRVKTFPLLIVLTHRPEFHPKWDSHGHVTALNLSKLTRAQSGAIVDKLTQGKELPAGLLDQILNKTDGVPLYVEELTKSILESGELKAVGNHYDYAEAARSVTIPATLRDSLMARLDRFAPVKEIAQIGAAIGREFSYELIAAVAPHAKTGLDSALAQLTESGLAFRRGTPPEATYTFKHALVQDAAYDSLLKSRRRSLHGKIASVVEERFPDIKTTEPELLAHHYTEAGMLVVAVPYWRRAGEFSLHRMALTEAIAYLEKGLKLCESLEPGAERDEMELGVRSVLGTAWMALRGWAAQQVADAFYPALKLARSLRQREVIVPISFGLWAHVLVRGRIAESLEMAEEALVEARATANEDLLIVALVEAMISQFWIGNLVAADDYGEKILAQYSKERHGHIVVLTNVDPKTATGIYGSHWTWMLGYPERARKVSNENAAYARQRAHPFDLGFALNLGAYTFDYRHEPDELFKRFAEAEKVGRDASLPFISEVMAQAIKGVALLRAGDFAAAITQLKHGISMWSSFGANIWNPYLKALLAEATVLHGDVDSALEMIETCIEQTTRPGWAERCHLAEILRLKGWMLSLKDDLVGAEKYRAYPEYIPIEV